MVGPNLRNTLNREVRKDEQGCICGSDSEVISELNRVVSPLGRISLRLYVLCSRSCGRSNRIAWFS